MSGKKEDKIQNQITKILMSGEVKSKVKFNEKISKEDAKKIAKEVNELIQKGLVEFNEKTGEFVTNGEWWKNATLKQELLRIFLEVAMSGEPKNE
jgi:coproporphyrinogen III oxidase-like Fe-S oxidoreductase